MKVTKKHVGRRVRLEVDPDWRTGQPREITGRVLSVYTHWFYIEEDGVPGLASRVMSSWRIVEVLP
jgi:hypothetical protein